MMILTKKLVVLLGMLAVMMGTLAPPAMTQEEASQYGPQGEFIATGVLGEHYTVGQDPGLVYPITDEATGAPYELQSGYVDLEPYVGQNVTVYGTPTPGIGTPPRYDVIRVEAADDAPPPVEEVAATGVIEPLADNADADHGITDEATGTFYALQSSGVDLDAYADGGQRVAVYGTLAQTLVATEYPVLVVSRVEPLDRPGGEGESVAVDFELAVECEPPADATFFGRSSIESFISTQLVDPDGDGLYAGSMTVPATSGGQGGAAEPLSLPVEIVRGTGTQGPDARGSLRPGEPIRVIRDFGTVTAEDATFEASVSFCDGGEPLPVEEISAAGILEKSEAEPVVVDGIQLCALPTHAITDEATGAYYDLTSDAVDLEGYVGKRVALTGTPLDSPAIEGAERCPDLDVTRIELLDGGQGGQGGNGGGGSGGDGNEPDPVVSGDTNDDGGDADAGNGGSDGGAFGGMKTLPATGGALLGAALAGLALVAGGLLVRGKFTR